MKNILFVFLLLVYTASAQKANYFKRLFVDAEYYVLFKEYDEALPLYLDIYNTLNRKSANISYRIGECYLSLPGAKKKALSYLLDAVKDVTTEYEVGFFNENKAPVRAVFLLGKAYRVNYQLDSAINTFSRYKKYVDQDDVVKMREIEHEIQVCYNAKSLMKSPVQFWSTNVGKIINSSFANVRPAVSFNDSNLVYTSRLKFYDAIFHSTRQPNGKWGTPVNLSRFVRSDGELLTSSLSPDGKQLFLVRKDIDNYNIYQSVFKEGEWQRHLVPEASLNTKYNETHACFSPDGNTFFFVSDREGGIGGKDIYKIEKNAEGQWGKAMNLGPIINTIYDEETPFLTEDSTLYFSSKGHFNMGGHDIFKATYVDGAFEKPVNMGYPLNTTDDDLFFMPHKNGLGGYYAIFSRDGFGNYDIYRISFQE